MRTCFLPPVPGEHIGSQSHACVSDVQGNHIHTSTAGHEGGGHCLLVEDHTRGADSHQSTRSVVRYIGTVLPQTVLKLLSIDTKPIMCVKKSEKPLGMLKNASNKWTGQPRTVDCPSECW